MEASGIWLQNLHRTGETDSWRAQTKPCVHQDPEKKNSDPTRDWPRLLCECPGVSSGGVDRWWPAAGLRHWMQQCGSVCMGPFERGYRYLHYVHHHLVSGQTIGKEHSHPTHQLKIGLKIYWARPCPTEQDPVSPQSLFPLRKLP